MSDIISFFLHLDVHMQELILNYGLLTYVILFLVIFCETGLVFTPFLPGDSLLFVVGAFCASQVLNFYWIAPLLLVAAILGDALNYLIGFKVGLKLFEKNLPFLKREHLVQTQEFYREYGTSTIILARFIPIVRTFAPFVAGIGKMKYSRFATFNIIGGVVWVLGFLALGYFFGNIPWVKHNLSKVILAIIFLSILPAVIKYLKVKIKKDSLVLG